MEGYLRGGKGCNRMNGVDQAQEMGGIGRGGLLSYYPFSCVWQPYMGLLGFALAK